uniref:Uncharacterized protein n=1 Tax=Otus sunia TaxID=257818 RepID=A0A8C8A3Y4_9STRI
MGSTGSGLSQPSWCSSFLRKKRRQDFSHAIAALWHLNPPMAPLLNLCDERTIYYRILTGFYSTEKLPVLPAGASPGSWALGSLDPFRCVFRMFCRQTQPSASSRQAPAQHHTTVPGQSRHIPALNTTLVSPCRAAAGTHAGARPGGRYISVSVRLSGETPAGSRERASPGEEKCRGK